jgi:hypothetical protein
MASRFIYFTGKAVLVLVIGFPCVRLACAQAGSGLITGEVRDPNALAVSNVLVKAVDMQTNQEYATRTDPTGSYTIPNLKPAPYNVVMEKTGFRRFVRSGVQLATGEKLRVDASLEVGDLQQTVTVSSDAPFLRSETGSLGQVIGNNAIVALPLNGRSFISLARLASGVALPPNSALPRINGGRPRTNEYLYDGISVLQPEPGTVAFFPIIDAIQEFKIETNSPPAEFGRFNGGVVNLTTKSGTNGYHGSVFEFLRNEALNARNLFAMSDSKKPEFRRNQFGGVIGGPIVKNRTFFFADYQGTRQAIGRVSISTVPTLLQRQGIFAEAIGGKIVKIYDPETTAPVGTSYTRQQFTGNAIPLERIDTVAALLLQRYPLPTSSGTANNYRRVANEQYTGDQFDGRIDHNFSEKDRVYGRYSFARDYTLPVTPLPDGDGSVSGTIIANTLIKGQSIAGNWLHSFSDTLASEFRFGYTRRSIDSSALLLDTAPSQALGIPGIPSNAGFTNEMPIFSISGYQQLGPASNADSKSRTDVTEVVYQISKQRGRHSIKAGLDFRWERLDIIQPSSPAGQFSFSSLFTDLPGTTGTGLPLASFLLGQVQTFSIDLQKKTIRPRAHIEEYFVQDDWKATSRFTVNAGVRWTLNFPSTEVDNQGAVFNPQTQQLDYLSQNGMSRSARELHWHDFGPRLGLAYRVGEKTAIRAAYALVWIEQAGVTTPFTAPQFPFLQTVSQRTLDSINPAFILSSGPSVAPISYNADAGLGQGVFTVDRSLGSGYVQQWNLFIQRELAKNFSLEIGYTGSKITHLGLPDTNINQLTVSQLSTGSALLTKVTNPYFGIIPRSSSLGDPKIAVAQLLKPYPRFTNVSYYRNNVGNSNYHALQARFEKRFSNDLSFLASYTFSKLIDEASSVFSSSIFAGPVANYPVADSYNRKLERDVSTGDIPQIFTVNSMYRLPIGHGRQLNPSGILGALVGGWEASGLLNMQSGVPLAVTQSTNYNSFAGFGIQRPNRIANPELPASKRSTAAYFNAAAFTTAPQFTIGSSSRNPVRGPYYRGLDIAMVKRALVTEHVSVEFRTEVFNLTNTPPLGAPNVVLGSSSFGTITSAGDPRVIQFGLKINY